MSSTARVGGQDAARPDLGKRPEPAASPRAGAPASLVQDRRGTNPRWMARASKSRSRSACVLATASTLCMFTKGEPASEVISRSAAITGRSGCHDPITEPQAGPMARARRTPSSMSAMPVAGCQTINPVQADDEAMTVCKAARAGRFFIASPTPVRSVEKRLRLTHLVCLFLGLTPVPALCLSGDLLQVLVACVARAHPSCGDLRSSGYPCPAPSCSSARLPSATPRARGDS